jgi:hypothetical protein
MTILAETFAGSVSADHWSTVEGGPLRPGDPTGVGEWRLVSRLGRGGMADVFYAIAPGGGTAAVKILRAGPHARTRVAANITWHPRWLRVVPRRR